MRKVALIILNWNGQEMILNCLTSVLKANVKDFELEIIVVDNGSTDGSAKYLKELIDNSELAVKNKKLITGNRSPITLRLVENKENLGFAEGNNVGIREALKNNADYICLLNNDTRVDRNFLVSLIKAAEEEKSAGILGGKIYFEKGFEYFKDKYSEKEKGKVIWYAGGKIDWLNVYASHRGVDEVDKGQYEKREETEYVNGCLMLIKSEVFGKIGLLNPKYYLYYEENDFCQRAQEAGYKLFYEPKSVIWHLNAGSSGSGSSLHDYFLTRNRMIFGLKYAPFRSKAALIKESFWLLRKGRKWQKKAILDFYKGNLEKGSWK
ncbi:glycosyltransferase family 2 protein [Patescibacteria group bacterium]|nr:glycosyltransferase family 2 protein [Patescibacteria group bacterium]